MPVQEDIVGNGYWEFFVTASEGEFDFDAVSDHELFDDAETAGPPEGPGKVAETGGPPEEPEEVVTFDNSDDTASESSDDDSGSDNSDDDKTYAPSKRLAFLTETEDIPDRDCPPSP